MTVEHASIEPEGLAAMIGDLVEQNLARDPSRRALLRQGVAALAATDAGVAITLRMSPGRVVIEDGADRQAQVLISGGGRRLLELAAAPLRFGLPDLLDPRGRRVIGDLATGRVQVRGGWRHPVLVRRITMLLSAA